MIIAQDVAVRSNNHARTQALFLRHPAATPATATAARRCGLVLVVAIAVAIATKEPPKKRIIEQRRGADAFFGAFCGVNGDNAGGDLFDDGRKAGPSKNVLRQRVLLEFDL